MLLTKMSIPPSRPLGSPFNSRARDELCSVKEFATLIEAQVIVQANRVGHQAPFMARLGTLPINVLLRPWRATCRRHSQPLRSRATATADHFLAEAIRARLVVGEATVEHRRLATALPASSSASAAKVAEHWRRAEAPDEELEWRFRAARTDEERLALAQAADRWRRALVLWPADLDSAGSPPLSRSEAYLAAMDALMYIDVAG